MKGLRHFVVETLEILKVDSTSQNTLKKLNILA